MPPARVTNTAQTNGCQDQICSFLARAKSRRSRYPRFFEEDNHMHCRAPIGPASRPGLVGCIEVRSAVPGTWFFPLRRRKPRRQSPGNQPTVSCQLKFCWTGRETAPKSASGPVERIVGFMRLVCRSPSAQCESEYHLSRKIWQGSNPVRVPILM